MRPLLSLLLSIALIGCVSQTGRLQGEVWLKKSDGSAMELRGLAMRLCPGNYIASYEAVAPDPSLPPQRQYELASLHISGAMDMASSSTCPFHLTTGANGDYRIDDIPPGSYALIAGALEQPFAVYWRIPVTIGTNNVRLDLNQDSAEVFVIR